VAPAPRPLAEETVALVPANAGEAATDEVGGVVAFDLVKGRAEVVRAQLRTYRGRRYVDVRTYYWDERGAAPELRPTRKGISLAAKRLCELRGALDALAAALDADGEP
jgi:hypothetical protein